MSLLEMLHIDTMVIFSSHAQEDVGRKEGLAAKSRGLRAGFPSDRTLKSMVSFSTNTFSVLSDD